MQTPTQKELRAMALAVIEATYHYNLDEYGYQDYTCQFCHTKDEHTHDCPYSIALRLLTEE